MTTTSKMCWFVFLTALIVYSASLAPQLVREAPGVFMISTMLRMFALHFSGAILALTSLASLLDKSNARLQRMTLDVMNVLSGVVLFQGAAILMKSRVTYVVMEYIVS